MYQLYKALLSLDARLTIVSGRAERLAALESIAPHANRPRAITLGADKGNDAAHFVEEVRTLNVRPHMAQQRRHSRPAVYAMSQRIEEAFGWIKTIARLRKTRLVGRARTDWAFTFATFVGQSIPPIDCLSTSPYDLVRLPELLAEASP